MAATGVALGARPMEGRSLGVRSTVDSRMAARHPPWGVGWSGTEGEYVMVVAKDTQSSSHIFETTIDIPSGTSASILLIVVSVELTVEVLE